MEERKTAAIVLSILASIIIVFTVIIPYIDLKKAHTLTFKSCRVSFYYRYSVDTTEDTYTLAQNRLALCLCQAYGKNPDTTIGKQIMKIYLKYGSLDSLDTINKARYNNLDTVLKYRDKAFDPKIAWD